MHWKESVRAWRMVKCWYHQEPTLPVAAVLFQSKVPAIHCPLVAFRIGSLLAPRKEELYAIQMVDGFVQKSLLPGGKTEWMGLLSCQAEPQVSGAGEEPTCLSFGKWHFCIPLSWFSSVAPGSWRYIVACSNPDFDVHPS